jgi:ketosteroid isomerase-like protein
VPSTPESEASRAAQEIVDAFSQHDRERYFAAFAEDSSFIFYTEPRYLGSRAEYVSLWRAWESEGFKVESCSSEDAVTHMVTDTVAVFTHRVRTRVRGAEAELHERETIVLHRQPDGRWLAVHEHLSPLPAED